MNRWTDVVTSARWTVVLAMCAAAGCSDPNTSMVPQPAAYLPDVPVPRGYQLRDKGTVDVMMGTSRIIRHRYRGPGRPLDVRNFYEAQMPTAGWIRQVVQNNNGHYNLQFEKQGELCSIDVSPSRAGFFGGTIVRIAIVPRSHGAEIAGSAVFDDETAHSSTSERYAAEASARP